MSLPLCQILAFQPARYPLYLVNLVTKRQPVNIVFDLEIHTYDGSPKTSTGNSWPFPELLLC